MYLRKLPGGDLNPGKKGPMPEEPKARILLVDDEHDVRTTLERMLLRAGYAVTTAESAERALSLAATQAFDVLITDVYMTGAPGDQLAREIQSLQPDVLPLLITAYPDMDLAIRSMNQGVRKFLLKPISIDALHEALAEVLDQRQQETARARRRLVETLLEQREEAGEDFDLAAALKMATSPGPGESRPGTTVLVLCEALDLDAEVLRSAERFRHFRTIHRAQRAFNGQLQRAGGNASVRLAVVSRLADLHQCLQVHGDRVHSIVLGPTFHRQSADLIRLLAASRRQRIVICHAPEAADISWAELRRMTTSLPVSAYRASAPREETITFWADYFTQQVRPDLGQPEAAGQDKRQPREAARRALGPDFAAVTLLPSFPEVCQRVVEAIDEGAGFERIAEVAALDGPLLTTLVHRANAAAYGSRRIDSVLTAVATIGTAETRKLLMGRALGQMVRRVQKAGFSNRDFFLHSASVGFIAHLLSVDPDDGSNEGGVALPTDLPAYVVDVLRSFGLWKQLNCPPGHDAFAAGMLHDIGKVALAAIFPDAFPQITHEIQRRQWQQGSRGAERVVTGTLTHAALGAELLENWGIFPQHGAAVADHHHVDSSSPATTVLISLANCLAKALHPFPSRARLPQPERGQFLGLHEVDESEFQANPLLASYQNLQEAFERQRHELSLSDMERESERYEPASVTGLIELARRTVGEDDRQYLGLLLNQNPEFVAVAVACAMPAEDLVALNLLLQAPIRAFVADLLRLTAAADPLVRRAMVA